MWNISNNSSSSSVASETTRALCCILEVLLFLIIKTIFSINIFAKMGYALSSFSQYSHFPLWPFTPSTISCVTLEFPSWTLLFHLKMNDNCCAPFCLDSFTNAGYWQYKLCHHDRIWAKKIWIGLPDSSLSVAFVTRIRCLYSCWSSNEMMRLRSGEEFISNRAE